MELKPAPQATDPFAPQAGLGGSDPFAPPAPLPLDLPPQPAGRIAVLDRPIADTIRLGASWALAGVSRALAGLSRAPAVVGEAVDPFAPAPSHAPWGQALLSKVLMAVALLACLACAAKSLLSLVSTASTAAAVLAVAGLASSWTSPAAGMP